MAKPNLKVDELTQDDTSLFLLSIFLLLTNIRVCFYYLLTSRALKVGRSRPITTLYPGAPLGPDRAQAGQTPATKPWRFWDLTNRDFPSSALAPEVCANRAYASRH